MPIDVEYEYGPVYLERVGPDTRIRVIARTGAWSGKWQVDAAEYYAEGGLDPALATIRAANIHSEWVEYADTFEGAMAIATRAAGNLRRGEMPR